MNYLAPRDARAQRAAERWAETDPARLHGVALEVVQRAAVAEASTLLRDLTPEELASVCAAAVDAEEQRQAEEVRRSEAEEERLAYLARTAERLRLTRDG
ncbi:MAG TPA: hypothetical protein VGG39_24965 [Polyangiaceae bacterium]